MGKRFTSSLTQWDNLKIIHFKSKIIVKKRLEMNDDTKQTSLKT